MSGGTTEGSKEGLTLVVANDVVIPFFGEDTVILVEVPVVVVVMDDDVVTGKDDDIVALTATLLFLLLLMLQPLSLMVVEVGLLLLAVLLQGIASSFRASYLHGLFRCSCCSVLCTS